MSSIPVYHATKSFLLRKIIFKNCVHSFRSILLAFCIWKKLRNFARKQKFFLEKHKLNSSSMQEGWKNSAVNNIEIFFLRNFFVCWIVRILLSIRNKVSFWRKTLSFPFLWAICCFTWLTCLSNTNKSSLFFSRVHYEKNQLIFFFFLWHVRVKLMSKQ